MPIVDDYTALLSGKYWNGIEATGTPVIVTFSFPTSAPAYDSLVEGFTGSTISSFVAFTPAERAQAITALNEWAAASGLVFIEVAPGQGDVNFQNVNLNTTAPYSGAGGIGFYPFGNWDFASYPSFTSDLDLSGDVYMNSSFQNPDGTVAYGTLLHEIGHAIGLKHPTEIVTDRAAQPNPVIHDQVLSSDDAARTIMAQSSDGSSGGTGHLLPLDEQAAAFIYGAAGTGGVYTASASGTNAVSNWSWDAATQTLTQTAVTTDATIRGSSVNDIINGSSGDDRLFALGGNDQLYGGAGNDSLFGGPGTDSLIGGTGDDTYYVNSLTTTVMENPNEGNDTVNSTVNFTLPANVENLTLFGANLTGTGNDQSNVFFGDGSNGQTFIGGAGDDFYHIFNATTTIIEQPNAGNDTVYSTVSYTLPANVENLGIFGANLTGTGNELDNALYGDISSGQTLIGGAGDDFYAVYNSSTTIIENPNSGNDTVSSTVDYTLPANVETLFLFGTGLTGQANDQGDTVFADPSNGTTLIGGAGADTLYGGNGNDTIIGGGGPDLLYGRGGSNIFVFKALTDAPIGTTLTTIGDFSEGQDKIDLSAIPVSGGRPLTFTGSNPFSHTAGEVHQVTSGSDTIVEGDVNGDGVADFQIKLPGNPALQARDFSLTPQPCYRAGTHILTAGGEVAVEHLAIGDRIVTMTGQDVPVQWIGHRRVECARHPDPRLVWPVRVLAGAFGKAQPHRDLFLSPDHAVFVEDRLIPIRLLINGASIVQMPMAVVTYYHIELPRHDVMFAEGLAAESYLDTGNRGDFANGGGPVTLHPNFSIPANWPDGGAEPLTTDEVHVEPVRKCLMARSFASVHLQIGGLTIRPVVSEPHRRIFVLPRHAGARPDRSVPIRLVWHPGVVPGVRPGRDDPTSGVCFSRIVWHDKNGPNDMPTDHPILGGTGPDLKPGGALSHRSIDGDAVLPHLPDAVMLEVHLAQDTPAGTGFQDWRNSARAA